MSLIQMSTCALIAHSILTYLTVISPMQSHYTRSSIKHDIGTSYLQLERLRNLYYCEISPYMYEIRVCETVHLNSKGCVSECVVTCSESQVACSEHVTDVWFTSPWSLTATDVAVKIDLYFINFSSPQAVKKWSKLICSELTERSLKFSVHAFTKTL